jgi:uncharacterized delta-60 repeat protein
MARMLRLLALATALMLFAATAALAAPGDLDGAFQGDGTSEMDWTGTDDVSNAVLVQPDGKVVVAGFGGGPPESDAIIGRLTADGGADTAFNAPETVTFFGLGGTEQAYGVARQPDGKLVAVGQSDVNTRALVMRVNADGTPDSGFGANGLLQLEYGGTDAARDVVVQPDGKIVTAGYGTSLNSWVVTRLSPGGVPDPSFDGDGSAVLEFGGQDFADEIVLLDNGKLVVVGDTSATGTIAVARLNADGSPDNSFDGDGRKQLDLSSGDFADGVAVQPDGKIVVIGDSADDGQGFLVTRLNASGSLDAGFASDGTASIAFGTSDQPSEAVLQANGKIVVAGTSITGVSSVGAVARLQPGGTPDSTFSGDGKQTVPGMNEVNGITLQSDGKLVATGAKAGAAPSARDVVVARLEGDLPEAGGGPGGAGPGGGGGAAQVPRCAGKKATIVGRARADRLKGTRRADVIVSLGGNDKISAGRGNDVICAGGGNDKIDGGSGNDRLYGQNGKDKLGGGSGKDKLSGGGGKDQLSGGGGRDSCAGDGGKDRGNCEKNRSL